MYYPSKVVKRRGFTALELIIVLVVGFSIIALSASKMGQLFSASSTASAMSSILDLFMATRSIRSASGYGTDDLMTPLIKAKMIPKSLVMSEDKAFNEWKGEINIKGADNTADGIIGFNLTYTNVPGEACAKITQNLLHSGNFMLIKIGTFEAKVDSTPAEVINACAGEDDPEDSVDMEFQFRE